MPNLKQILTIKSRFGSDTQISKADEINDLFEGFDISKGFEEPRLQTKSFSYTSNIASSYFDYFNNRSRVNVVLLFIDITSFSGKFNSKKPSELGIYLDRYYSTVLPIITKHGGVVEKIIGDGIVCLFGEPFLYESNVNLHRKAESCCQEIIKNAKGTDQEVKIALHYGEIMYFHNTSVDYWEFTMIGNALTELFRLENLSYNNCINFYCDTPYERLKLVDLEQSVYKILLGRPYWSLTDKQSINISNIKYTGIRMLRAPL